VARKAREKTLSDVSIIDGDLRISPLRKNTPEPAESFSEKVFALMNPRNRQALLTAVLADGINLGLTRISEACRETTWRQLSWTADWHVREECYAQALAG
jgi:hypothetical protein